MLGMDDGWLRDQHDDVAGAQDDVSLIIANLARVQGAPQKYNRTVTDAWVRIVAHCRAATQPSTFDELLISRPWLLDKRLLMRHYTSRTLASDVARREWVEPDVLPLPVV